MTEKKSSIYLSQLKAMIIRNLLLKKREKRKTAAEILLPLYSLSVLVAIKMMVPNPNFPAITTPRGPIDLLNHISMWDPTIAVAPSSPQIEEFLSIMNELWLNNTNSSSKKAVNISYIMFKTKDDLAESYWTKPDSIPIAIVFENDNPIKGPLNYQIRTNPSYTVTPPTTELLSSPAACREIKQFWSGNVLPIERADTCPANQYYYSEFTHLQILVDYTKISIDSGTTVAIPQMFIEMFPKAAFTGDWMVAFRLFIPTYMVMALSQFVTYLLILIVGEKEKRIKEGMKIMGLRDSVFWLSWFIIYAVFVSVLSIISVVLLFWLHVFQHTSPLLIFLLILLYSFSIIMFSFMLTPLFDKARTAGILGNFAVNIMSLLYFIQVFVKDSSSIILWLVSFISSSGFALALDKAIVLDLKGQGVNLENLWSDGSGGVPFGGSLIMMVIDIGIYGLLAYYLDSVVPSEYGTKRPVLFCFYPSFWNPKKKESKNQDVDSTTYVTTTSEDCDPRDVEPVTREVSDREAIKIVSLHKRFTSCKKQEVNAVNGINLSIYEGQITAILGHNGAGKTTLINILTGLTGPSSGTVYVFGHDVRDPHGMACIHRMTGVCPQHDILFDHLTPREHLRLFAAIRGVNHSLIEGEIEKTLQDVNLTDKGDTFSKYLSGGQKRKLSVGIAIIGDPKIIILDEPTAGVDPYSRRHMWSLLQNRRKGKVILLTTHFMDEADILADRKAVISKGRLRCCGSSLFLKNKFGIGYHLTLVLDSVAKEGAIASMVCKHVPRAEKARRHGRELSFILPHNAVDNFAPLFLEIEKEIETKTFKLGISSYGVSMTTLEEVFLHLEKDEENDFTMDNLSKKIVRNRAMSRSMSLQSKTSYASLANNNSELAPDINDPIRGPEQLALDGVVPVSPSLTNVTGIGLDKVTLQQKPSQVVKAMLRLRVLRVLRDAQKLYVLIITPLILSAIGLYMNKIHNFETKTEPLLLSKDTYRGENLVIHNGTNHSIKSVLDHLDAGYELYDGVFASLLDISPHLGAINFDSCCHPHNISLTLLYNDTAQHSLPSLLNSINNAIYKMVTHRHLNQSSEPINVRSYPFQVTYRPEGFNSGTISSAAFLGMIFVLIPISLATDMVYDREIKAKNQLRVNGLSVKIYFGTYFIVLVGLLLIIFSGLLVLIFVFDLPSLREPPAFCTLGVLVILYCPASILFSACVSYIFDKTESAQSILPNIANILGLLPFGLVCILDMFPRGAKLALILHCIFSLFNTMYIPYAIIYFVDRVHLTCRVNSGCPYLTVGNYLTTEILVIMIGILIHIPFWFIVLLLLDVKKSGGKMNGWFSKLWKEIPTEEEPITLPEGEHEDSDVKTERMKVNQVINSKMENSPVVLVHNLQKEYNTSSDCLTSCTAGCTDIENEPSEEKKTPTTKVAIKNLSLAVEAGEVFGLLGHNGAGKTTTMKVITAEEHASMGRVYINGLQIESNVSAAFRLLGYCPQHDVQWKNITIREHLEVYAAIRGVVEEEIPKVVDSFLTGLQIHEHANKEAQHCSGGTRRKLSFAIAMIGNPCVVLLDEPSTGMDPKSKRFLWDTIIASFKGSRGAILTTQSMEEADALCSRVGIMVKGELRCIGSTQHLKNLYGAGYNLEMKLKHVEGSESDRRHEALKQFVDNLFSDAVLDESFVDRMLFSIPQHAVKSLSECFTQLEKAKTDLDVEEYSFSQTTLEQVFLKFAQYDQPEEQ